LSRTPDAHSWYSHPLDVKFTATDSGSGVSSCSAPVTYSGPDSSQVTVSGGCVDAAGNKGTATATFQYDSTAPSVKSVDVSVSSRTATLTWKLPKDAASVVVTRTPGRRGKRPSQVYDGRAASFHDRNLQPGITYRYLIAVTDAAGNRRSIDARAVVPALYLPAAGARVGPGAMLAWAATRGATYYNVQIFRGSRKVLSVWPKSPRLRLPARWSYAGKTERLSPGRYRWYVWPGHGALKAARYGALLGGSSFVVR
jgi:hypothetical protein